ncbi:MAG: hypothetical protein J1D86_00630 [Alistipes sp.]|nr:hypothetical protein [Alistipes sp.]
MNRLKILLLSLVLSAAAISSAAGDRGRQNHNPYGIDTDEIERYFAAVLRGEPAAFTTRRIVAPAETEQIKALVWEAWRRANESFDQPLLPQLTPLAGSFDEKQVSGVWPLLEGEQMQFFYGSKGDRPRSGYPLFLCLHGSGDNDYEFRATLAWAQRYDDAPSAYFIPRSPKGGTGCRWYQPSRQQAWERLLRQAFLFGEIDPDHIYVFGISEGGYGSQRLASFYADYLAGAGPIAGGEQMFWAPPENCASIAFCLQTGDRDTMYGRRMLVQRAQQQWSALQQAHPGYYQHKIDLQPGYGHGCDYTVTTPYLKNYARNPYPKYVCWENLPQGNINGEKASFRSGFYNLSIRERSTDDSDDMVRSFYRMTIDDNTVSLDVEVVTVTPGQTIQSDEGWTMNIGETKTYEKATRGRIVIYLNDKLVDMSRPVTVKVNGKLKFKGRLKPCLRDMVTSCGEYFDPARLYPASVEVTVE